MKGHTLFNLPSSSRHFGVAAALVAVALASALVFMWPGMTGQHSATINDLKRLRAGNPVELTGIVTFADPVGGFYFQDQTGGMHISLPPGTSLPSVGDRIELNAVMKNEYDVEASTQSIELAKIVVKVKGQTTLPKAQPLSLVTQFSSSGLREAQRVTTRGVVRAASVRDRKLVLELADVGQRMPVTILNADAADAESLIDAHVTVTGVLQLDFKDLAGPALRVDNVGPHLWVASIADLEVTNAAPAQIALAPSVRSLIVDQKWVRGGARVRIQGSVAHVESEHVLLIENGGLVMPVETPTASEFAPGDVIEATGWPTPRRFTLTLQRAQVKRLDPAVRIAHEEESHTRPITEIARVRQLTNEQAAAGIPVSLTGVLTMVQRSSDLVFIQSGEEAIFVDCSDQALDTLERGQSVRISGLTGAGGFAPVIRHPRIEILGKGTMPPAQKVDPEQAPSGTYDSEWVEIEGLVRPFTWNGGWYKFNLLTPVGVVNALIIEPEDAADLESLVDAKVRVQGVFATVFTVDGVLAGYRMFVYSPDSMQVINPSTAKSSTIETRPIQQLLRFSNKSSFGRRSRIEGVVTLRAPSTLYVQDETGSAMVQTLNPDAQPGDRIEAIGYPAPSDHGTVISDAVVRRLGKHEPATPERVTAEQILSGNLDNRLVSIEARVLSHVSGATQQTVVLQDAYTNFNAQLDGGIPLEELREGSIVRITGVTAVQRQILYFRDYNSVPASFRMLLRSADDVVVVKPAPWWNLRHAWPALSVLSLSICLAMLWVFVLRRRVQHQTAEIEGQRAFLRQVIDMCPNFIFVKDADGRFTLVNRAIAEAHGLKPSEMIGKSDAEIGMAPEQVEAYRRDDLEVLSSGQQKEVDEEHQAPHGQTRWVHTVKRPLLDDQGRATKILGVANDISLHKFAQDTLRNAREVAESANRAKSEFLANMSHEIRTPLNGILGMTTLCMDTELSREQREYVETVKLSADGLLIVINDILDFSKIEAGKLELENIEFDVRETLDAAVKTLALRAHQKGLELVSEVACDVPAVLRGDSNRLRQVLLNLLGNAIKFTETGEVIARLALEAREGTDCMLRFTVSDTGIGIPPDRQQQIFKPFVQADSSTTREFGGTGLGLTISSRLVAMMDGGIWVESEPGRGSDFHFTIRLEAVDRVAQPLPAALENVRVLIVDDNETLRRALCVPMRHWKMRVDVAADVAEAMRLLDAAERQGDPVRLLLTDIRMPEVDGAQLIQRIRQRPDLSLNVVAMLTTFAQREEEAGCRALGVTEFLVKPLRQHDLREALVRALTPVSPSLQVVQTRVQAAAVQSVSLNVLLAEDNAVNQLLMVRLLQKRNHRVVVAGNGRQALAALEREAFDLVLMDVQMPELDGLEATQELRRREQLTQTRVPVIALTAHAMTGDREMCLAAGMDGYLTKPINVKELDEVLHKLGGNRKIASNIASAG
ncbi:MAG: response regulator [Povalibacter sp.]